MPRELFPIVTCEHAGNDIPDEYRALMRGSEALLPTHRGWDPGALSVASAVADALGAPLVTSTVTRLLVDLNRSPGHPGLLSPWSRQLKGADRIALLERYYLPFRQAVHTLVAQGLDQGLRVQHISVHSFTPALRGKRRHTDVGLLFDPRRSTELAFALRWQRALRSLAPSFRVRRNYPYLGTTDGFMPYLRLRHSIDDYVAVEIELNQRFPRRGGARWEALQQSVVDALSALILFGEG